jgi:hypothetical protein
MVDVSEKSSTKTPGVLDGLHGAVDNAYTRKLLSGFQELVRFKTRLHF